jgi:MYXO-CTERM domain-containing protein
MPANLAFATRGTLIATATHPHAAHVPSVGGHTKGNCMRWTLGALGLGIFALAAPPAAHAESLFSLSGKVALANGALPLGTKVKFQVDLDRNGKLESFETLSANVGADGSYKLKYELSPTSVDFEFIKAATEIVATYKKDGFDGLLKGGPLPVVMSFEREGYTTVVKRLRSMSDIVDLDAVLAPLSAVHCIGAEETCVSASGDVRLTGFPGGTGIAKAYASAYDPAADNTRFPGTFSDDQNNLLISSGFAEINLYDAAGKPIHEVSSAVAVRFEAKREQWKTLPDLTPGSGGIELPMYSFDQEKAEWVREGDGELQFADGAPVPEDQLAAIRAGTFDQQVFVAFDTMHFSSFNCDAPITERACVRGRLVDDQTGEPLIGISAEIMGVSYTGSAGGLFTGQDGRFAIDVMKSENPGEDSDRNGTAGETFSAQLSAKSAAGVFLGSAFNTPLVSGSATLNKCRPSESNCFDLGDVPVAFEAPRLCQVTITATSSGKDVLTGSPSPTVRGTVMVGANIRAALTGSTTLPQSAVAAVCEGQTCGAGEAGADGAVTISVPVIGDAAQLRLDADFTLQDGEDVHMYSGTVITAGCAKDQTALAAPVAIELDHASAGDFGAFISSLGEGALMDDGDGIVKQLTGCGCRVPGTPSDTRLGWLAIPVVLGLVVRRRRARCALSQNRRERA